MNTNIAYDTKIFFLGLLCRHGHNHNNKQKTLRYIKTNNCVECSRANCIKNYHKNRDTLRAQARQYYWNNPGRKQKKNRDRRNNNIEAYAARDKAYYERNKKKVQKSQKRYHDKNRTKLNKNCREYYHKNRDNILAQISKKGKEHRESNSKSAIRWRLRGSLNRALKEYSKTGKIMASSKYGINYKAIMEHLGPHPNTLGIKGNFHIDHIIPLSAFDLNDPEQIILSFAPGNHQWLRAKDNKSKFNRIEGQLNLMTQPQLEAVISAAS